MHGYKHRPTSAIRATKAVAIVFELAQACSRTLSVLLLTFGVVTPYGVTAIFAAYVRSYPKWTGCVSASPLPFITEFLESRSCT